MCELQILNIEQAICSVNCRFANLQMPSNIQFICVKSSECCDVMIIYMLIMANSEIADADIKNRFWLQTLDPFHLANQTTQASADVSPLQIASACKQTIIIRNVVDCVFWQSWHANSHRKYKNDQSHFFLQREISLSMFTVNVGVFKGQLCNLAYYLAIVVSHQPITRRWASSGDLPQAQELD